MSSTESTTSVPSGDSGEAGDARDADPNPLPQPGTIAPPDSPNLAAPPFVWPSVLVVLYLFTLSVFVPWNPSVPALDDTLDASWPFVLHWAHLHHIDFGHHLAFTFGPWGFLNGGYMPETFKIVVAAWILFATVFFLAAVAIVRQLQTAWWLKALWLAAFIAVIGASISQLADVRYYSLCWLLLLYNAYVDDRPLAPLKIALTISIALTVQIRFSAFPMAAAVMVAILLQQIWRRRIPWLLLIFVVASLGWWLAADQPISGFAPYLQHSWWIANGYVDGEQISIPSETMDVTIFALGSTMLLVILLIVHPWHRIASGRGARGVIDEVSKEMRTEISPSANFFAMLGLAGILFALFKAGYVRHDYQHEMLATASLALISMAMGALFWPRVSHLANQIVLIGTILLCTYAAWGSEIRNTGSGPAKYALDAIVQLPNRAQIAANFLTGQPIVDDLYTQRMAKFHDIPLAFTTGNSDFLSFEQIALLAKQMDYRPRPVFQSYLTYTPELAQLNADFFAGPDAPDNVYFNVEPIDVHYPAQEDALAWPVLLSRYEVTDATDGSLLLKKSATPRSVSIVPIQESVGTLGQWVDVPQSDDPIWVGLHVTLTGAGQVQRFLYKPTQVVLRTHFRNGVERDWRLQISEAEAGFLLSPCILESLSFAMLNSPDFKQSLADCEVTKFAIASTVSSSLCYEDHYGITFSRLKFDHYDVSHVPGLHDFAFAHKLWSSLDIGHSDGLTKLISVGPQKSALLAPPKTYFRTSVPRGAKSMHLGLGILPRPQPNGEITGKAEFYVVLPSSNGETTQSIFGCRIDATDPRAGKAPFEFDVPLNKPLPPFLIFITDTPKGETPVDCYWSDIEFH